MGETEPPPNHFFHPLEVVGTSGTQKCRGSGAPSPNLHPNHPLRHAMRAATIVLDVVAKAWTVATNFLRFCMAGSVNGMTFAGGVSGVHCRHGIH